MDATEIIARVSEAKDECDLRNLVRDLERVDSKLLFDTLFPIAVRQQGIGNGPVAFSASAIHAINPPCQVSPRDALEQMIDSGWDLSIEEVPWYLANQFGAAPLLQQVRKALNEHTRQEARVLLKAIQYWARLHPANR